MSDLRSKIIRLAHQQPALRPHLLPLLKEAASKVAAGPLSWPDGDRSAPWTPWGPAQYAKEATRGVRLYGTAGHGGLAVAKGVAQKALSAAATKMAEFSNGYYWYEEDVAISIPLYEHPEWARALGMSDSPDQLEKSIRSYFPRYFAMKEQGIQHAPPLKPGMVLSVLKPIRYGSSFTLNPGDMVTVRKVSGQNFVLDFGGNLYRMPVNYYIMDDPYVAIKG